MMNHTRVEHFGEREAFEEVALCVYNPRESKEEREETMMVAVEVGGERGEGRAEEGRGRGVSCLLACLLVLLYSRNLLIPRSYA